VPDVKGARAPDPQKRRLPIAGEKGAGTQDGEQGPDPEDSREPTLSDSDVDDEMGEIEEPVGAGAHKPKRNQRRRAPKVRTAPTRRRASRARGKN
jgi:hypothetical protein